jgi:hypothetical protein
MANKYFFRKAECENCDNVWEEKLEFGAEVRVTPWSSWAYYRVRVFIQDNFYNRDYRIACKKCGSKKVHWRLY